MRARPAAATALLTCAALAPSLLIGPAHAGGGNQVVKTVAVSSAPTAHRAGVQAIPYGGSDASSTNLAQAESRDCTGCRSVAAAFQAVFATGNPNSVRPTNAAVAVNDNCDTCFAYAYAYQIYVTADRGVSITETGRRQLAALQAEANRIVAQRVDGPTLSQRLDGLRPRLVTIVQDELRRAGARGTLTAYRHQQSR